MRLPGCGYPEPPLAGSQTGPIQDFQWPELCSRAGGMKATVASGKEHLCFVIRPPMGEASNLAQNSRSYVKFWLSEILIWHELKVSPCGQRKGKIPELRDQSYYFASLKSTAAVCFVKLWYYKGHPSTFPVTEHFGSLLSLKGNLPELKCNLNTKIICKAKTYSSFRQLREMRMVMYESSFRVFETHKINYLATNPFI